MKWLREPEKYHIAEDRIEITTMPHTDLWQRTYYHFRNNNAPVFQMDSDKKYFSFIVKTDLTAVIIVLISVELSCILIQRTGSRLP